MSDLEAFGLVHMMWYDVTTDELTSIPPNVELGEN